MRIKELKKRVDRKCYFCDINDYELLHAHRIIPGEKGGKYTDHNILVVCPTCHTKIHADQIVIHAKHYTTAGKSVIHCTFEGEEKWL